MTKIKENKFLKIRYLVATVIIVFLIKLFSIQLLAIRFEWGEGSEVEVFGKSLNTPLLFLIWIAFIPYMKKISQRFPITGDKKQYFIIHIFLSILISLLFDVFSELLKFIILYFYDKQYYESYSNRYLANYDVYLLNLNLIGIVIYWTLLSYISSISYYLKYRDESLKRAEAESLIVKAELNALKMQIQPHFLFNTLHSISSLIDEEKEEAQEVIGRLGDLLRYTLDQKKDFIPLKDELDFIDNYLQIEKTRFKDRLIIKYDIQKDSEDILIASFILQPLIENTIKHGLSKTKDTCTLSIIGRLNHNSLEIIVEDNALGSQDIVKGIGLENTENRLKNYYESDFEFNYGNIKPKGFRVFLKIPVIYKDENV